MSDFKKPSKEEVAKNIRIHKPAGDDTNLYDYVQKRADGVAESIFATVTKAAVDEGGLILLTGSSRSGKSTAVLKLAAMMKEQGEELVLSRPIMHRVDMVDGVIQTDDGEWEYAQGFEDHEDIKNIFSGNGLVVVDDVMFTPYEVQAYLVSAIKLYIRSGGWVVAIGNLHNANGNEFLVPQLLKYRADVHFVMKAMCLKCGERTAVMNQRLVDGVPASMDDPDLVEAVGDVSYEPRCNDCYVIFH